MEQGDRRWYIPGVGVGWQDIVLLIKMLKSGVEFLRLLEERWLQTRKKIIWF